MWNGFSCQRYRSYRINIPFSLCCAVWDGNSWNRFSGEGPLSSERCHSCPELHQHILGCLQSSDFQFVRGTGEGDGSLLGFLDLRGSHKDLKNVQSKQHWTKITITVVHYLQIWDWETVVLNSVYWLPSWIFAAMFGLGVVFTLALDFEWWPCCRNWALRVSWYRFLVLQFSLWACKFILSASHPVKTPSVLLWELWLATPFFPFFLSKTVYSCAALNNLAVFLWQMHLQFEHPSLQWTAFDSRFLKSPGALEMARPFVVKVETA